MHKNEQEESIKNKNYSLYNLQTIRLMHKLMGHK